MSWPSFVHRLGRCSYRSGMNGSLRKRGNDSWQLRVYLGTDATTRRPRWATTTVHGSKRYAQQQLAEFVRQADYGKVRAGTVTELLDRWVAAAGPRWAVTTRRENCSIVEHHLKPHLGHLPVGKLTTADVDDFYASLLRSGRQDGSALTAGRVERIHGVLHRAFTQAVTWDWVWINPVSMASPPRVPPPEISPPTIDTVAALFDLVRDRNPALCTFLQVAACTGARRSHLLGLRWREIDFEHSAIGFTRAFVDGADGPQLQATKTHRTYRVAIDPGTLGALVEHWRQALEVARAHRVSLTVESFVFSHKIDGSEPWLPGYPTQCFRRLRRSAGLTEFRLHDYADLRVLRHFMATEMLGRGVPVPTVSQRLGHACASTTLNVYAHRIPGSDRDAAELIGRLLDPDAGRSVAPQRRRSSNSVRVAVRRGH